MPVNAGLATVSDQLFVWAILLYSVALMSYCGEYAFGRRGRVAATAEGPALVGAGVSGAAVSGAAVSGAAVSGAAVSGAAVSGAGVSGAGVSGAGVSGAGVSGAAVSGAAVSGAAVSGAAVSGGGGSGRSGGDGSGGAAVPNGRRLSRAERFGRIALAATVLGLGLQLASLTTRGLATDRVPWGNMYEFSSVVGAAAVAAFLGVLARLPQIRYLGMFLLMPVVVLLFLAGTVLYADAAPLVPALRSYWIVIHVTSVAIGTGIFLVSSVGTVLYLVRRRWDAALEAGRTPKRFPVTLGWRLPPAEVLDKMAYRAVAFGFPIYTFGIISGAIWAEAAWGRYWGWDPKETWAFITWVVYAAYLHARATAGWRGTAAARVNLVAFATMIFNFFVVNMVISGLHSYAGLT